MQPSSIQILLMGLSVTVQVLAAHRALAQASEQARSIKWQGKLRGESSPGQKAVLRWLSWP